MERLQNETNCSTGKSPVSKWHMHDQGMAYSEFLDTVELLPFDDCVIVFWSGMWLGIETDGYCHS